MTDGNRKALTFGVGIPVIGTLLAIIIAILMVWPTPADAYWRSTLGGAPDDALGCCSQTTSYAPVTSWGGFWRWFRALYVQ